MQLDLLEARAAGQEAAQRASDRNEARNPGWCLAALELLRVYAKSRGDGWFIIEHARTAIEADLPPATDQRAWGVVATMALRRGYIEQVKGQYWPAITSHG